MSKKKKKEKKIEAGVSMPKTSKQQTRQAFLKTPMPPPAFISDAIKETKKKPEPKPEDDDIIALGAGTDFWKLVKRFINYKTDQIKSGTAQAVAAGNLTMEQYGFKSILKDVVSEFGDDIINFVEGRAEVMEQIKIQKQQEEKERADESNKPSKSE